MRRIFVSSTNRDLESYRRLASESLRKRGYDPDDEAIFNLTFLEIGEQLKQRIEKCDAVVCLIGFVYGGEPSNRPADQPRRSYTQWECILARELKKPVYLLLADEKTPFDPGAPEAAPSEPESDELRQLQKDYRTEVIRDRDWRSFASKDQLRAELAELRFPWEPPRSDRKPCNLPFKTIGALFKGREAFLDDLRKRIAAPDGRATAIVNTLAVHGLGGVGKTRAAIEYAWGDANEYTALLFVSGSNAGELRANLANLAGVLGMQADGMPVEQQLAEVLHWLDAHPGWLLVLDNVDTDEAAREVEGLLPRLRAGQVLITSRIGNWSAGVEPLELHVLAPADAEAFLLERTPHRRRQGNDAVQAAAVARELDGLALALEQAGAYIDKLRLSFAEYLQRWESKRPEVLRWHDLRLMQYPASVAVTWETTLAQLAEPERRLLEVLAWLAPEPIPLFLFDAPPLAAAIADPRAALAGLAGYSLARFDAAGDAVLVHRLVQEITRGRVPEAGRIAALRIALETVNAVASGNPEDVRTWEIWTPLAAHAEAVSRDADAAGLTAPTTRLMNELGLYWQARGQFGAAEPLYRRGLAISERSDGSEHPNVATSLNSLARLLAATNRLDEAEPLYRRASAIYQRSFGRDHPYVATSLNNLASLLQATNRLGEAEPLFRRVVTILEASLGPDHPNVAAALNNLALLLGSTNRMPEAEPLHRRALAISEQSYGSDHPTVAIRLNNLAKLLRATNRMPEAEAFLRRALAIDERSYGPDHAEVATDLNNLAELLRNTNRMPEAEPLFRRVVTIFEASLGPDHPNVATALNNLALLLYSTNCMPEAEPLYRRALAIDERSYGPDHPDVARDLNNLARLLGATNRLQEAEPFHRRALVIDERSYGPDHPDVARDLNNLAIFLGATNRLQEAEPFSRRGVQILIEFQRRTGHEHPDFPRLLANYREFLKAMGKTSDQIEQQLNELGPPAAPGGLVTPVTVPAIPVESARRIGTPLLRACAFLCGRRNRWYRSLLGFVRGRRSS